MRRLRATLALAVLAVLAALVLGSALAPAEARASLGPRREYPRWALPWVQPHHARAPGTPLAPATERRDKRDC